MHVYDRIGVQRVINASGKMTALGGTALSAEVAAAMAEASQSYVNLSELSERAGKLIAEWTGAEAACVTSGAAAGIAQMVAACVAGTDPVKIERLPDVEGDRRNVLIQPGHCVTFGAPVTQMIRLGGGRPVPVGHANGVRREHLEGAIDENTVAFLYVQSHHTAQHDGLPLADCIAVCHAHGVPVLLDAAAEEDLEAYVRLGVDAVTYSGGKAFGGPTSGFIAGRRDLIAACRAQQHGIARPMKVSKEAIVGLLVALEQYVAAQRSGERAEEHARQRAIVAGLLDGLAGLPGTRLVELPDEAGRDIVRVGLTLDAQTLGVTAADLAAYLREGKPPIFVRGHRLAEGTLALDPRPLDTRDVPLIVERIRAFYAERAKR